MIPDCQNLIHPFQNDPGTSQHQRYSEELLTGKAKIDNRSLADLIDFFRQLSGHVNYYDEELNVNDWQPFFEKSLPFLLASIIKYDRKDAEQKLIIRKRRFEKKPSASGLHLLLRFTLTNIIKKVHGWHMHLAGSGLPAETVMNKLIQNKLSGPLKNFIKYANAASQWYGTPRIDFSIFIENTGSSWLLKQPDLFAIDDSFLKEGNTHGKKLLALYSKIFSLVQTFQDAIGLFSKSSEQCLEQSLVPLQEEFKEKHQPHLAILFAFIKLFQYLQADLNTFTRKHLDFFYKQVLRLKPKGAEPDHVHLVLDIQQQLDQYLLTKGIVFKGGKDNNKADILFSSEDEIVVNKAQVADQKSLFLNNQSIRQQLQNSFSCENMLAIEGVYMAPDSTMADGVDKPFKNTLPSRSALGSKWSKHIDPEKKFVYPYPNARLGFVLSSPVLLLREGKRTIKISLACQLLKDFCNSLQPERGSNNPCCDPNPTGTDVKSNRNSGNCMPGLSSTEIIAQVENVLNGNFYYISQPIIDALIKKGIGKELKEKLQGLLIIRHRREDNITGNASDVIDKNVCFCGWEEKLFDVTLQAEEFISRFDATEQETIKEFIYPIKALKISFSGEKEWIHPLPNMADGGPENLTVSVRNFSADGKFELEITATILPEQEAITFYNPEALKEDINITLPALKVELNDKIKISLTYNCREESDKSCCKKPLSAGSWSISLYQFFREVQILKGTKINVQVCGVKNLIVQNDESLQDVNAPIYPFGTRPEIIDFDIKKPMPAPSSLINLVGPNFYIGSKEVFCKKWNEVNVNITWKDKPSDFNEYYKGYLIRSNYHTCDDPENNTKDVFGLNECDFEINLAILENGVWKKEKKNPPNTWTVTNEYTQDNNRKLFLSDTPSICNDKPGNVQTLRIVHKESEIDPDPQFDLEPQYVITKEPFEKFSVNSRNGFLRINLQNQDFLHKDYSYVLARQMMAFGRYPDLINGAVYDQGGIPQVFDMSLFFGNIGPKILDVASEVVNSAITGILNDLIQIITDKINSGVNIPLLNNLISRCKILLEDVANLAGLTITDLFSSGVDVNLLPAADQNIINLSVRNFVIDLFDLLKTNLTGIEDELKTLIRNKFNSILDGINVGGFFTGIFGEKEVIIPNEPWTPVISTISIDYAATAVVNDIKLIHLHPYNGTFKAEELVQQPMLFPTFCDEGNLFLGLKNLIPGSNVNILFQVAEATADSESGSEVLKWYYLENNEWKLLRTGFEILNDDTNGLTKSGIIKFAMPANMTSENTILPIGLHWIKASIACNSKSVSEILGIHTQAIKVTFSSQEINDSLRLDKPLESGSVSKLKIADSSVKNITQPYDSFDGRIPEEEGHFYLHTSELLRHKNRAVQKFDYERLVLEAFPKIFKVKCINHSYALDSGKYINDFPVAPGYLIIAVIPDLHQLKASMSMEPKAPVSLLDQISSYLKKVTSPFVRLRILNPRYEKVNFCIRVKLQEGKDEVYYKEQIKEDIKTFLAPWSVGEYEKLSFGQSINRSDIVGFLETRNYIDYILDLNMSHENILEDINSSAGKLQEIVPVTPRSILIAGSIDVCIDKPGCETWCRCYGTAGANIQPCCDHSPVPFRKQTIETINKNYR